MVKQEERDEQRNILPIQGLFKSRWSVSHKERKAKCKTPKVDRRLRQRKRQTNFYYARTNHRGAQKILRNKGQ